MLEKYQNYPNTPDSEYFAYKRDLGDLPEQYWEKCVKDYREIWDFWKKEIQPFGMRPLWENGAPGFREDFGQDQPSVGVWYHEGAPRGMILVCAGGGFLWKADYEGPVVARKFFNLGFNVAVLDYRVAPYKAADSIADAKRAIRYLRYNAEKFNTLPDHIAIGGFSAGGMLTNMCATDFDSGNPDAEDPIDRVSCRPDAAIPCYGSFSKAAWPGAALGYDREHQRMAAMSSADCLVNVDCPPFFIWQCQGADDPRNAMNLAGRLAVFGIPFELHLFPYGPHGTSLADGECPNPVAKDPHVAHWVELCAEWLRIYGF